jgi:hypothetical protein
MVRVEFRLAMPGCNSWNGRWSGEGRNYSIVRNLTDKKAAALLDGKARESWGYNFGDGWFASVEARVVPKGERLRKSDGFAGYEWMVSSILADGEIYGPTNPKPGSADDLIVGRTP